MIKYIFLFICVFSNNAFFFRPSFLKSKKTFLMKNFEYAKEYFDFYNEFKHPVLLNNQQKVDYISFAKSNNDSYFIFEKNYQDIKNTNALLKKQNKTLVLGINEYMDNVDLDDNLNNLMVDTIQPTAQSPEHYKKIIKEPFQYINTILKSNIQPFSWNDTGLLSPVKSQGQCGSCWAFSATSSLETFMRSHNYSVDHLSEQELVDCSSENSGCNGGLMHLAFEYIMKRKGLASDSDYPYHANHSLECLTNLSRVEGSNMTKYSFVIPESIVDMKYSVHQNPVAIAIDANNIFFRFYRSGVIDVPTNISKALNHAVLLVGYDFDDEGMYWIIQNSWSKKWGENGYCKIRVQPKEGTLLCQQYGVYPTE